MLGSRKMSSKAGRQLLRPAGWRTAPSVARAEEVGDVPLGIIGPFHAVFELLLPDATHVTSPPGKHQVSTMLSRPKLEPRGKDAQGE